MITVTFIRHAESEYNVKGLLTGKHDCNLSSKGIEDSKNLKKELPKSFDIIYCSPLKRTKQTLEILFPNSNPIFDERIIERSAGIYEGKPKSMITKEQLELYKKGLWLAPGAESIKSIDKRVSEFINELFEKYSNNEKILVVTHDGIINSIKRNFLRNYDNEWTNNLGIISINSTDFEHYKKINQEQER